MSIASEITSIGENLKKDYQSIANLGADLTNADKNIENIAELLDGVYDNLPKTEYQEGTEITLSNTLKGKLDFEDGIVGYGDTKQDSTKGYQLINGANFKGSANNNGIYETSNSGLISLTGTATDVSQITMQEVANKITLPAGTYTLSANNPVATSNNTTVIRLSYVTNGAVGSVVPNSPCALNIINNSKTFTINEQIDCVLQIRSENGENYGNTGFIIKPMLEIGSTAHSWEKYTGGIPASNPSYPQDIEVVRGKNRLDDSNLVLFNSNKYISTTNYSTQGKIAVKPNTTYTLAYKTSTLNDMGMWEFDSSNNKTAISYTPKGRDNYSIRVFTTLSTTKTMSFYAGSTDTYTIVEEFLQAKALMLLEGDYSSQAIPSYLPYNTIEVVERGKNLLEITSNSYISGGTYVSGANTNQFKITATTQDVFLNQVTSTNGTYNADNGNKISCRYGETIYFASGNEYWGRHFVTEFNSSNTSLGFTAVSGATGSYTPTHTDCSFITMRFGNGNGVSGTTYTLAPIVCKTSDISYEPYQTPQTYQLSLGEYEFAKIGNYVDTIEYDVENDKVYKNEKIGKTTYSSSVNWQYVNGIFFKTLSTSYQGNGTNIMSNYFKGANSQANTTGVVNNNADNTVCISNGGERRVYLKCSTITSLDNLDAWFSTHNTTIYYVLETPVLTEITDTTLINQVKALYYSHSFNGTTIIEINGQLPLIIKVRALKGE